MLGVEIYERIRRAYFVDGWTIRKIARKFGHDRRLVRKAIADSAPKPYRRTDTAPSVLDPHREWIDQVLLSDRTVPRKQRHTAKRIFDRLVIEREFRGAESSVRNYVAQRKAELGIGGREVYTPLDHPAGRDGQADYGDALVKINGRVYSADVFSLRACYSGALFVCAFPIQKQEAFFECLRRGMDFLGGVFHRITFDNLKQAVKKVLTGRSRVEQDAFVAFRSHHLFESFFTLPGKQGAHEKGGVEGGVGYGRRNWLVPIPEMPTWEALNEYLLSKCQEELGRTAQGKREPIGVLLERERPLMLPLPQYPFDCCRRLFVRADSHARIRVDGIRYSVPTPYAYRELVAKVYVDEIVVVYEDRIVARHRRRFLGSEQELDPLHYIPALEKKPHLIDFGLPFVGWRLPKAYQDLRQKLEEKGSGGLKDYIRVLQAIPQCDVHTVACAIDEALRAGELSALAVLSRLADRGIDPIAPRPARPALSVAQANLSQYDQLIHKEAPDGNGSVD